MPTNNFLFYLGQIIAGLAYDVLWFPLWWYSRGWWELVRKVLGWLADSLKGLNLAVWLKNLFVPMYGQRDLVGILISVFMRLVQIVFRGLWFLVLAVVGLFLVILWPALPLVIIWQLVLQAG